MCCCFLLRAPTTSFLGASCSVNSRDFAPRFHEVAGRVLSSQPHSHERDAVSAVATADGTLNHQHRQQHQRHHLPEPQHHLHHVQPVNVAPAVQSVQPCPGSPLGYCSLHHGACAPIPSSATATGAGGGVTALCLCDPGWGGDACDALDVSVCDPALNPGSLPLSVSAVAGSAACSGRGVCVHGACSCDAGYTGTRCEAALATCPQDCNGRGVCHHGTCFCAPGFAGDACLPVGMLSMVLDPQALLHTPHRNPDRQVESMMLGTPTRRPRLVSRNALIVAGVLVAVVAVVIAVVAWRARKQQRNSKDTAHDDKWRTPSPVVSMKESPWWR